METIGLFVTCICSCSICCHMGCCGCCMLFIGGIANLARACAPHAGCPAPSDTLPLPPPFQSGSSVPMCCKSNKCQNLTYGTTASITIVLRVIAIIIFSMALTKCQDNVDSYDSCLKDCYEDTDENYCERTCENSELTWDDRESEIALIKSLKAIVIITGIWLFVSLVGAVCGFRACSAEDAAEKQALAAPPAPPAQMAQAVLAHAEVVAEQPKAVPSGEQMQVQVPPGAAPGAVIVVQTPSGAQIQVAVPAGAAPGQVFMVQLPPAAAAPAEVDVEMGAVAGN